MTAAKRRLIVDWEIEKSRSSNICTDWIHIGRSIGERICVCRHHKHTRWLHL